MYPIPPRLPLYPPMPFGVRPPMFPPQPFPFGMPPRPPMPMVPPPPPVALPRQLTENDKLHQKLLNCGLEDKVTAVWVGKISPLIEDETVKKLLEFCGDIKSWARVEVGGQLKSFGFCHFINAEGALRSLRLLDGIKLGEQKLKLNVDANTTRYIDDYEKRKNDFIMKEKAESESAGKQMPVLPFTQREEKDKMAKEQIETLVSRINKALENDGEGDGVVSREIRNFREKQARAEKEKREREEEEERRRRAIQEEEERREKKRKEFMEIEYEKTEREWHEYEKDMQKERERQTIELAERKAKRKRDLLLDDEDDKVNRRNIRSRENRRRRMREKEEDERERAQEIKLEEAKKQEALRREAEEQLKKKEQETLRMKQEQAQRWERGEMDVKGKAEQENFSFRIINETTTNPEQNSPMSPEQMEAKAKGFSVALKPAKRTMDTTKQLGFTDEPEEDTMVPKKIVLTSLDIEMSKKAKQNDARILAKNLIEQIPVEKEALFAYVIDWNVVDEKQIVEQKMRPWVTKKIVELLDEEEPTLIEFLCKKLSDHSSPQDILDQLQIVLDDEASAFVIKMWRMLIFNMLNV